MSKVNKRLLLILAIICVFLIIPVSFASDLENNTLSDNAADVNSIYVSINGNDTTADGSADKPYQSISKAVENYDSSVNSNIFVENGTYVFDGKININKNIAILGQSSKGVIFDGNNTSGFFSFDAKSVSLKGISFVNANDTSAIHTGWNLIIDDCKFENNSAGALSIAGGSSEWDDFITRVQVKNSEFINNSKMGWDAHGGAISAGGIYYTLNITNCVFARNSVSNYGGAIYLSSCRRESYINACKFIANNATEGSAIYMGNGYDLTITRCDFINNTASNDNSAVISLDSYIMRTLTVGHNAFVGNSPSKDIDADNYDIIYLDINDRLSGEDVDMNLGQNENFTVTLTDASENPISGKLITVNLVDSLFRRTTTYTAKTNDEGQAIIPLINQTAGTYAVTSIFAGDEKYDAVNATNSIKIKSDHSYNIVFNESVVKVKAGESYRVQGIVTNEYLSYPIYAFSTFDVTWKTHSGGTRYTTNYQISNGRFIIDVLDFDLSTQNEYYYIYFTATNENQATAYGTLLVDTSVALPPVEETREVIYVSKDGSDEFGDGSEENPLATPQTALYVNEVFGGGRTVFVKEGVYNISNYEIYANVTVVGEKGKTIFRQHTGDEGMLYLDNWVTTDFVNITFTDGYRAEMVALGGCVIDIRYAGSIAHFTGCEFYNNSGSSDGMMYVAYGAVVYIDDCIFKNNSGKTLNPAGAILVLDAYLSVNNSYFIENYGAEGGAIFVAGDSVAFIENTEFRGNIAYNDSFAVSGGGAIYVNNWNTHITNCSFIDNYAELNGGAIYILIGKVEIDKCYFENNRVKEGGGSKGSAIASDSGYTVQLYVSNSILISDNYSKQIAIVNDMAEENEIILNGNHWGNSGQSVKDYVVVKITPSSENVIKGDLVEITVQFVSNTGEELEYSVHDYLLNVSANIGGIDKDSIKIVDNVAKFNYYANVDGDEIITLNHGRQTYSYKFIVEKPEVEKMDFSANISVDNTKTNVIVEVPDDILKNITIILDGNEYSIKQNNGIATLPIDVLPGNHTVRVTYAGDREYKAAATGTYNFNVDKYDVNLAISVNDGELGDDFVAMVTANERFNETIVVTLNNSKTYKVVVNKGRGSVALDDLDPGNYTATITFDGNKYFNSGSAEDSFKITDPMIEVIYVAYSGNDTTGNGSRAAPYATISKALDRNKKLRGNKLIIVSEGNYTLNRYAITSNVTVLGVGDVVISSEGKNHLFIGGNVKVTLEGLTFINGNGVDAGSIEMGSDDAGNLAKELIIVDCNFINNTGAVGAIKTYAKTTISSSTFINNTATGVDGSNQAIISAQDNALNVSYSIFLDNNYAKNIIVSSAPSLANNNFWGTNAKTRDVDKNVAIGTWMAVVPTIDDDVRTKTDYDLTVQFMETADGENFIAAGDWMPDLEVDLTSQIGSINQTTVTISNNVATVNYRASQKGNELITVDLDDVTLAKLAFTIDVPEYDKIYVSPSGNNSANGSRNAPFLTIEYALLQNNQSGGDKTLILLPGKYKEHDLVVADAVTIIGQNATIDGEGNSIFTVLEDAEMHNLTLTNANVAINHDYGELKIYGFNFSDSSNVIKSDDYMVIVNSHFAKNTGNVINSTALIDIIGCQFTQNEGKNVISASSGMAGIINSTFTNNNVNEAIYLNNCIANVYDNIFDSNGVALTAVSKSIVEINDNEFNGDAINLKSSTADLKSNNNTVVNIEDSTINNVILTFLNGETVIADNGTIRLNATVTDDMLNPINGGKVTFTSNGAKIGQADAIDGTAIINVPFTKGNYTISGSFDADSSATVVDGLLRIDVDYFWFIGEDKYETLAEAVEAANWGDVIKGVPGTYVIPKQAIGHRYFDAEPWEVLKSVTITSLNETPVTLTTPNDQMFFVDIGSELTLQNIIVANSGRVSEDGVIETLYQVNLTVINCTFVNNTGGDGGAIYAGGNLIVKDSVFDNNKANLGGAIEIAYLHYTTGQIIIENVNFTNNKAGFAGALYCGASDVDMTNVKFINNTANIGGALFVLNGVTRVTNAEFISNKVLNDETTAVSRGGAVHNMLGDLYFENTKFINNTAEGIGGALELENGMYGTATWTTFDNCEFINNSAENGGAMYLGQEYDPYVRITNSVFDSNVAAFDGAAIYDNCGHVTIEGTSFTNNNASGLDVIHVIGEFISGEGFSPDSYYFAELTIEDSSFANDNADYVIFSNAYGIVDVRDTTFDNEGMIIFNRGEATFIKNTVTNSKDAVIENYGNLSLRGNVFDTPILNQKDILTTTYIVLLDNETKSAAVGENYTLKAVITDDNGNIIDTEGVTIVVDTTDVETVYNNGEFNANYTVTPGTHLVTAKCNNTGLKELKLKTGTLVAKNATELVFKVDDVKVGENATITVNVNPQATGNITVVVNNKTYVAAIKNGVAVVDIDALTAGEWDVEITYSGDDNYAPKSSTEKLTVSKIDDYLFDVDVSRNPADKTVTIDVSLPSDVNTNVTVIVDGKNYAAEVKNGKASVTVSNLTTGNHELDVIFDGDDKYANSSKHTTFKADKSESFVEVSVADIYAGENAVVNITVPDDATGDIIISFADKEFYTTVKDGKASYILTDLEEGNYEIEVTYNGNGKYLDSTNKTSFKVINPLAKESSITVTGVKGNSIIGVLKDGQGNPISGEKISYVVNGKTTAVTTGSDGSFAVPMPSDGKMEIKFAGNDVLQPANITLTFEDVNPAPVIVKVATKFNIPGGVITIKGYAVDTKAKEEGIYYATELLDANGNPVKGVKIQFAVNDKIYKRTTNEKGSFNPYKLNMVRAGRYTMAFYFAGDDSYEGAFASVCVDLDKKPIKIKASNKSFKATVKTKKYTVTLSTIVGSSHDGKAHMSPKTVKLKVNGKTYSGKTNSKGKVTFKIKNLSKKAKYVASITVKGDGTYNDATKTVKLTIK